MKTEKDSLAAKLLRLMSSMFGSPQYNIEVTTTADSGAGSLRAAAANIELDGTITFCIPKTDAGYDPASGAWTIKLRRDIQLRSAATIEGGGKIILDGGGKCRMISCYDKHTVALEGLALRNGCAADAGAVCVDGDLVATDCAFIGNSSKGGDGAVYAGASIVATNCSFIGNASNNEGDSSAACAGDSIIAINCVFAGNRADSANSATIDAGDRACLFHATIADNIGAGVCVGAAVCVCNSIIAGNSAAIQIGISDGKRLAAISARDIIGDSLIEGISPNVTRAEIFGGNKIEASASVLSFIKPLKGGSADKSASALDIGDIALPEGIEIEEVTSAADIMAALQIDIAGAPRSSSSKVSYGAKE